MPRFDLVRTHDGDDAWAAPTGWAAWGPEPPVAASGRSPAVPWCLAAVLLVLALLAAAAGASGLWTQHRMDRDAVAVRGTVISVDATFDVVDVAYPLGRSRQRTEVSWYGVHPRVGESVDLEYHPDDPAYARVRGGTEDRVMGTAFLVVGGVLLGASGSCVTWAVRRRRRLSALGATTGRSLAGC